MSKQIAQILIVFLLLIGCNKSDKKADQSLLNTSNISSQIYIIDPTSDTSLQTKNGAIIKIEKGSFLSETNDKIQLEIKEAYSITDIITAGLITKSNGIPLSSGGMIYINAVKGTKVSFRKAISVSIPTTSFRKEMELYKGVPDDANGINWQNPTALPENETTRSIRRGQQLFSSNCASCHAISKSLVGPALAYITERRDWDWLKRYTRNNQAEIEAGDKYARCLSETFNKSLMNQFPSLSDTDLGDLYEYIRDESRKVNPESVYDLKKCFDSCEVYRRTKEELNLKREKLIAGNSKKNRSANQPNIDTIPAVQNTVPALPDNKVQKTFQPETYYQFTIEEFGWFNIDILLKNLPGFENSELIVRVAAEYKQVITVYLIIPSEKIFLDGGFLKGKDDEFGFYENDGKIPLPQGTVAYILAMGEYKGKIVFGKSDFITGLQQKIQLPLSLVSQEYMNAEIKNIGLKDLTIKAQNSVNATEIKTVVQELKNVEKIKPLLCDCNCGLYQVDVIEAPVATDTAGVVSSINVPKQ